MHIWELHNELWSTFRDEVNLICLLTLFNSLILGILNFLACNFFKACMRPLQNYVHIINRALYVFVPGYLLDDNCASDGALT